MKPGRVILLVIGSFVALVGFGLVAGGATLGWALATQRDAAGFFTTSVEPFETTSYAITSENIDLGEPGPGNDWWADGDLATVRVEAENVGAGEVFVGIAPEADVEEYLAGVPHDEVTELDFNDADPNYRRENGDGTERPESPAEQEFWIVQASGRATQTVTWDVGPGQWAIVIMNADASREVVADVELGVKTDLLYPLALGLGIGGVVLLTVAAVMIVLGVARPHARERAVDAVAGAERPAAHAAPGAASPVQLTARLDPELSRWQWLVKWFLAIPHYVVLAFLWIAFVVLTFVAFLSILFTGRYPRSVFEFNVGVLRWTWRVTYYATSAIGTDRYPPFTLEAVDYPADLDIAYPEQLSRGLVLVKSWLLALPHLIIVGLLIGSMGFERDRDGIASSGGGLLAILVVIAGFALLFTGRYPIGLFNLIVGLNRWVYRVVAYCALMTDAYPPFHLDQGGDEPSDEPSVAPRPPSGPPPLPPSQVSTGASGTSS